MINYLNHFRGGFSLPEITFTSMKCINFLLISVFIFSFSIKAQSSLYQARQIEGTEEKLKSFFEEQVENEAEIYYVFHLKPFSCPRCEGLINPMIKHIKSLTQNATFILIVDYKRESAVAGYLQARNFGTQFNLIDTKGKFSKFISFNSERLIVPFLYKINMKKGEILYSASLLGMEATKETAKLIIEDITPESKEKESLPMEPIKLKTSSISTEAQLSVSEEVKLMERIGHPISIPIAFSISRQGVISFVDQILGSVFSFDHKGNFISSLRPSEEEFRKFKSANVEESTYQYLVKNNIANVIYLKLIDNQDSSVLISASLPELKMESDSNLGYYNKIAFLAKTFDGIILNVDTLEWSESEKFFISHSSAIYMDDEIFVPCGKGWPAVGTNSFDSTQILQNPFIEEFYDDAPIFAVFSTEGQFKYYLGNLPSASRNLRTGYYFFTSCLAKDPDRNTFYLSAGKSGHIYLYDNLNAGEQNPRDSIFVFSNPLQFSLGKVNAEIEILVDSDSQTYFSGDMYFKSHLPKANREIEYFQEIDKLTESTIIDLKFFEETIFVLVEHADHYQIKGFDKANQLVYTGAIPFEENSKKFTLRPKFYLAGDNGSISLQGIRFDDEFYFLSNWEIKN